MIGNRGVDMNIFGSKGKQHIEGHKDLTHGLEVINFEDNSGVKVYFPTVAPNNSKNEVLVKTGDSVLVGSKIMVRTDWGVPIFSSVSGVVVGVERRHNSCAGRVTEHLIIESDGKGERAENVLTKLDFESATAEQIIAGIKEAGIIGLGGAGFPTHVKYSGLKCKIDSILINGVECEPYLTSDYEFMVENADEVVKGAELLRRAANAEEAVIAFKVKKDPLAEVFTEAIKNYPHVRFVEVPDAYPMGWEKTLVNQIFKKKYKSLPAECGVVVNNATTAAFVYRALVEGRPITHRLVTVSGDAVAEPRNILTPVGVPAEALIELAGGYVGEEVILQAGGPMTSKAQRTDQFVIQPAMNALTVLKPLDYKKYAVECLRCGECTLHCPAHLQPVEIKLALDAKDFDRLEDLGALNCCECGLCSWVCPSKIEVSDATSRAKTMLRFQQSRGMTKSTKKK